MAKTSAKSNNIIYIMRVSLSSVSFTFTTLSCSSQSFGLPLSLSPLCVSLSWQIDSNDPGLILISSYIIAIISAPRPDCRCYTTCLARCDALNKDSDFRLIFTVPKGRLLFFTMVSKVSRTSKSLHKNMYICNKLDILTDFLNLYQNAGLLWFSRPHVQVLNKTCGQILQNT